MLNFAIDPRALRRYVPAGTELDLWQGQALVSMVGFQFQATRLLGLSIPFHRNFTEVNLRFYVRRPMREGLRRGVVFIKEIVPRWAITWVARRVYRENYVTLPMRSHVAEAGHHKTRFAYEWRESGTWARLTATASGPAELPAAGSVEQFIVEHYWGYSAQRDGGTVEYQVEHVPWRVWSAEGVDFTGNVESLYGTEFVTALNSRPHSALVAEGSPILVRRGRRIT